MKKFCRFFAVLLAAAFVLAACDSSGGGGEDPREETASYVSTDGKTVLTLTYLASAQKSPARRAPAAGQNGTYTLTVDGVVKSEGTFRSTGATLTFTSQGGNDFTADVTGASISFDGGKIPLDGGGDLEILPLEESIIITEADLGLGSITNGALGVKLDFTNEQVYLHNDSFDPPVYTGSHDTLIERGLENMPAGNITTGKFTVSIGAPKSELLTTLATYLNEENDDTLYFVNYDNLQFSDSTVKCFFTSEFDISGVGWNGLFKRNVKYVFGPGNTFVSGDAGGIFVYVEDDVTFSGTGTTNNAMGITWTSKNFSISLKQGWNVLYDVCLITKGTYTGSPENMQIANATGTYNIKPGLATGLKWLITPDD